MRIATVDLDDTLIKTGIDYDNARTVFGKFVRENFGIDSKMAIQTSKKIDRDMLDGLGLSMERFPNSCSRALKELIDNPTQAQLEQARTHGRKAFKTTSEYQERGFMEGAKEMLETLNEKNDALHLITAGVEELQKRKIDALNLNTYFDQTRVVGMHSKCEHIREFKERYDAQDDEIFHIGNSEKSDVKAALRANANAIYLPRGQWQGTTGTDYSTNENVHVFNKHSEFTQRVKNGVFS
jgi:FMN phosphatase YigB (HAD superfamily)